jgi:hypothetical protein
VERIWNPPQHQLSLDNEPDLNQTGIPSYTTVEPTLTLKSTFSYRQKQALSSALKLPVALWSTMPATPSLSLPGRRNHHRYSGCHVSYSVVIAVQFESFCCSSRCCFVIAVQFELFCCSARCCFVLDVHVY